MKVETAIPLNNWRQVADSARKAEALGFDGVETFEISNDPFTPLAFAAVATERLRLGTAIAVAFPRSPMITANISWDLHTQSNGRFTLGLGTQVKGHNERRFSVPWSPPLPRLREYIGAMRAIWRCWELGEKLDFQGEHYNFTLMTPEFSPPKSGLGPIPVTVAAVRPAMMKMAATVCDGIRLHGFATRKYLEETALPAVAEGLAKSGRDRSQFELWGGGFIATGKDEAAVAKQVEAIRYRLGFYGSTRSYHGVLAAHGWEDQGMKLHEMSKQGRWKEMAAEVPDAWVEEFAAIGTYDELPKVVEERFAGLSDNITLDVPKGIDDDEAKELVASLKRIPTEFEAFPTSW